MVDIFPQTVSWPSPSQYIQSIVNSNPNGTTYVLKAGVHRMQTVNLYQGDTLQFEPGAILSGSEDMKGWTWTKDGANDRWYTTLSDPGDEPFPAELRSTFKGYRYNPIVDGETMSYRDSVSYVDEYTCYWDSGSDRLYIGVNPALATTVELCRQQVAIQGANSSATGVSVLGQRSQPNLIENYASSLQSENAAVRIGRTGSNVITNANWTFSDFTVRNCRGMALAQGDGSDMIRITVYNAGQLGVGGSDALNAGFINSSVFRCGMGGWNAGWEGGTTKWVNTENHQNLGCWFDTIAPWEADASETHPHIDVIGPLWYDISNDGADVRGTHILDRGHLAGRGFFWEISFTVHMQACTLYELGWSAENSFWGAAVNMSNSGGRPGDTIYDNVELLDSVYYRCAGGMGGTMQNRGSSGKYGWPYVTRNIQQRRCAIFMGFPGGFTPVQGTTGDVDDPDYGSGMVYEDSLYMLEAGTGANHFRVDTDSNEGSPNGSMNWGTWTGRGYDSPNGVAYAETSDPHKDFNPYRGGCL